MFFHLHLRGYSIASSCLTSCRVFCRRELGSEFEVYALLRLGDLDSGLSLEFRS